MTSHYTNRVVQVFLFIILFISPLHLWAQPANDDCQNAILLDDIVNFCSPPEAFTNASATSDIDLPIFTCPTENNNDVWFRFVAVATSVTISVTGQTGGFAPGGTLRNPEVQLLFSQDGNCTNWQAIECDSDEVGDDFISINKGNLVPGNEYFIRVQGRNDRTGTFQLCVNNFTQTFPPESDCADSHLLCDKSSFFVEQIVGAGADDDEAAGSCLDGGVFANSESNSTWYKWIAANDGSLTFTLTPENPEDDLDFALFELPDGINDCDNKILLRCMASGENQGRPLSDWIRCTGATGLQLNDGDTEEMAGCQPGDNNFVDAIMMEEGKTYALLINNFSETRNGFNIEFGGTGEFLGPQPDVELILDQTDNVLCVGDEAGLTGVASSFLLGDITDFDWNFGAGAQPATAQGAGTHAVFYETPGEKTVTLTLTTNLGCMVSEIRQAIVIVEPCCETVNAIQGTGQVTDVICGDARGAIDFTASSASTITSFEWSNNATTEDISDLTTNDYTVTVTNLATCEETFTFPVDSVAPFQVETNITMPTCNGGTDGAIELIITDGFQPIQIDFGTGTGASAISTLNNLSIGDYPVTIQDGNGCSEELTIEVRELVLELDSATARTDDPSCFGFSDGSIALDFVNGLAPYSFDWNDGNGFVGSNELTDLSVGTYTVDVVDQNLCRGNFQFALEDPAQLEVTLDALDISCAGQLDGMISAIVEGGTGMYSYEWSNGQVTDEINDLDAGTYAVSVLDANQCEAQATVEIIEPPSVSIQVIDIQDVRCFGEESGIVTVEGVGGSPSYQFSIDGVGFQDSPSLSGLAAGDYTVFVRDQRGCTEEVNATISQPEELTVDAGQDLTIDLGFTGQLEAVTTPFFRPVTFIWSNTEFLDCSDCPNPVVSTPIPTSFVVQVTDESNCTAIDSVFVRVTTNRPLYVPSAFSPNLDGSNDRFTLYGGPAAAQVNELRIFDRWGNLVYEAFNFPLNEPQFGWDGIFNGDELPPGVYVFVAKVLFIDDVEEVLSGDITLVK